MSAVDAVQKVAESEISRDLNNKFEALFPTWPTIVATLLSLSITLIVLTKLLYKPIKKMHDDRKKYIQNNIDASDFQKIEAINDRETANDELINARLMANEIVENAKIEANTIINKSVDKAKVESKSFIDNANKLIEAKNRKFKKESKEQIIEVALEAALKIIEKNVDNKTNRKIINDFIEAKK